MANLQYVRTAMEKDAAFASTIARHGGRILSGLKSFAQKPFSTTMKKLFLTRAKPGTIGKNVRSELGFGIKWGGGLGLAGTAATPFFTSRNI